MTGFFNCDSSVVGDAFRRMGHKAFEQMYNIFYVKAVDNLSTFEWQHATADYKKVLEKGISGIIDEIDDAPTPTYFNHYRTVNAFIDRCLLKAGLFLESKGYKYITDLSEIL
mgnify:CR=1 FL=1